MNFQINVITEEEIKTNASRSKISILRVSLTTAPFIIALIIILISLSVINKNKMFNDIVQKNNDLKNRKALRLEDAKESLKLNYYIIEIKERRDLHANLSEWLAFIHDNTPDTMQINLLSIHNTISRDSKTGKAVIKSSTALSINASHETSEKNISDFTDLLNGNTNVIEAVQYGYNEGLPGSKSLKSFNIRCEMQEREIK